MKYFSFQEFERSETAYRHGIDNTAPESARKNIAALVDKVLDPLREAWGKPITVTSGYRCAALNKAVGGSATSHHCKGMAADLTTGNRVENRRIFQLIIDMGLPFTQLIDEKNFSWVHVSFDPEDVKRQVLRL
ncbi:D-Ala-D-Ala carboxypeptidase family metallohydrolase [Paramuribaculum intestinale]|uniref:D-Ala-D-Ala carboxypeptidase family metallohydrolase n=1 Tax=Paramuribaculum intestinale TaxID=2094151 RepID=UPI0025AA1084|nr:D-Ala-D-Ala carboxypeptidase family metallohydrolase [Paramuribaculum intestinale]